MAKPLSAAAVKALASVEKRIAAKRAATKKAIAPKAEKVVPTSAPEASANVIIKAKVPKRVNKTVAKAPPVEIPKKVVEAKPPKRVVAKETVTLPASLVAKLPDPTPTTRGQVYFDKPRAAARPGTIRAFVEEKIMEHKLTDKQIHEEALKAFNGGPIPAISSYRWAMRAYKMNPPDKVV